MTNKSNLPEGVQTCIDYADSLLKDFQKSAAEGADTFTAFESTSMTLEMAKLNHIAAQTILLASLTGTMEHLARTLEQVNDNIRKSQS